MLPLLSYQRMVMQFLSTLIPVGIILATSIILLSIRQLVTGREFRGTCASNNSFLKKEDGSCGGCGRTADQACKREAQQKELV